MSEKNTSPKVFISYSWSNPQHEKWVLLLAERLVSSGIDVILDKWHLKPGQNIYAFMERMINTPDIKVLVICDKTYQVKADKRKGGVGTESQIISHEVYKDVEQERFIPIVREFDENMKPCLPIYFRGILYLDFSKDEKFEMEYEKLVKRIYNQPIYKIPESHIEDETKQNDTSTSNLKSHNRLQEHETIVTNIIGNTIYKYNNIYENSTINNYRKENK